MLAAALMLVASACGPASEPEAGSEPGVTEPAAPEATQSDAPSAVEGAGDLDSEQSVDADTLAEPLVNWTFIPTNEMTIETGPEFNPSHIAAVGDLFVAVGGDWVDDARGNLVWEPVSWYSADGTNWSLGGLTRASVDSAVSAEVKRLVPLPDRLLAVSLRISGGSGIPSGAGTAIFETSDGVEWRHSPIVGELAELVETRANLAWPCRRSSRTGVNGSTQELWVDECSQPYTVGNDFNDEGKVVDLGDGLVVFGLKFQGRALLASSLSEEGYNQGQRCNTAIDSYYGYGDESYKDEAEACEQGLENRETPASWRSLDGGQTWEEVPTVTPPAGSPSDEEIRAAGPWSNNTYHVGNITASIETKLNATTDAPGFDAWASIDDGRSWQLEELPPVAVEPRLTEIAGTGTEFIALVTALDTTQYTVGAFLGTVDREHPAVDQSLLAPAVDRSSNAVSDTTTSADGAQPAEAAAVTGLFPECARGLCEIFDSRTIDGEAGRIEMEAFNILDDSGYVLEVGITATNGDSNVIWSARHNSGFGFQFVETDTTGNLFYLFATTRHSAVTYVVDASGLTVTDFDTVDGPMFVASFNESSIPGVFDLFAPREGWPDNQEPDSLIDVYTWTGDRYEYAGCRPNNPGATEEPSRDRCPEPVAEPTSGF